MYEFCSMLEFLIASSLDCLKLTDIILNSQSVDPAAIRLELGWKHKVVIGDFSKLPLVATVQHY